MFDVDSPINGNLSNTQPNTERNSPTLFSGSPTRKLEVEFSNMEIHTPTQSHSLKDDPKLIKTRARPIKPHETEPFLAVDTLSPDKQKILSAGSGYTSVRPSPMKIIGSPQSMYSYLTPATTPRGNLSVLGRQTPVTRASSLPPNGRAQTTLNHHVKNPFKHSTSSTKTTTQTPNPCQNLKTRTAIATDHISQYLPQDRSSGSRKSSGRLRKGKLKPLNPVSRTGPQITQCRGVISQTKSYLPSPNKTLQRRLQMMNSIPNINEYIYQRPRTVESIHRTSAASSLEDNESEDLSELELGSEDKYAKNNDRRGNKNYSSYTQRMTDIDDEQTPRMFPTEIRSDLEDSTVIQMNNRLNKSFHVTNLQMGTNMNNNALVYINIRPQTADIIYDSTRADSPIRPVTADCISKLQKTVHFGDDPFRKFSRTPSSKIEKDINNVRISRQMNLTSTSSQNSVKQETKRRKMKKESNNSCKPEDKEWMDDNDDDDRSGGPAPGSFKGQGTSSASVTACYTSTSQTRSNNTQQNMNKSNGNNNEKYDGQEPITMVTRCTSEKHIWELYLFVYMILVNKWHLLTKLLSIIYPNKKFSKLQVMEEKFRPGEKSENKNHSVLHGPLAPLRHVVVTDNTLTRSKTTYCMMMRSDIGTYKRILMVFQPI
ncbi:hypothetical protein ScPMuIL_011226 [Solemya velum]